MDPHQDNNNDNADLQQQPSFGAFLGIVSWNDGWEKEDDAAEGQQATWLASQSYTPLEVALMMRANLQQIQIIYQRFPAALTAQTFRNACRHGAQPGVVGFLAQRLGREGVSQRSPVDDKLPIHLAMELGPGLNRPTDDDIQELVAVCPDCINEPALMSRVMNTRMRPWQLGLQWQYSPELLRFLFETLRTVLDADGDTAQAKLLSLKPGSRRNLGDNCRQVIDSGCVQAMSLAFDQIESFLSAGYHHFGQSVSWKADAIVECFQRLLQNQNVSGVHFNISAPPQQDSNGSSDTVTLDGQLQPAIVEKLANLAPHCGVRNLIMPFENAQNNPFYPALLGDPVLRMPHLQDLRTNVGKDVGPAVPLLRKLLLSSKTLHTLVLQTSKDPIGDLMPLLEVVRTNTTLRTFRYREDEGPLSTKGQRYQAYLADCLRFSNTALTSVGVSAGGSRRRLFSDHESLASQAIAFYTLLNGHGRGIARDRDTHLKDLLPLLNAAGSSDYHDRNVNYGLLRECPWLWSGTTGAC